MSQGASMLARRGADLQGIASRVETPREARAVSPGQPGDHHGQGTVTGKQGKEEAESHEGETGYRADVDLFGWKRQSQGLVGAWKKASLT